MKQEKSFCRWLWELGSNSSILPVQPQCKLNSHHRHDIFDMWSNVHTAGGSSRSWRAEQKPCRTNMRIWRKKLPRDNWKPGILWSCWSSVSTHAVFLHYPAVIQMYILTLCLHDFFLFVPPQFNSSIQCAHIVCSIRSSAAEYFMFC